MAIGNFDNLNFNQLLAAAACFNDPSGFFEDQREAADVHLRVLALKAAGGPDYTGNAGFAALMQAAASWTTPVIVLNCSTRQAIGLYLDGQNLVTDGGTFNMNPNFIMSQASAKLSLSMGKQARRNLLLYLKAAVNAQGKPE